MFEIEYLLESKSDANKLATHRSNVNEFLLAQELKKLAGHTSKKVGSSQEEHNAAQSAHDASRKMISEEEYTHQAERAKHMARQTAEHLKRKGIDIRKCTHVHVTSGAGAIERVTGMNIESQDNPSDVVMRFAGKKRGHPDDFFGVSAKSSRETTEGKGTERISNRGMGASAESLGEDWHKHVENYMDDFAIRKGIDHLPLGHDDKKYPDPEGKLSRKSFLRAGKNQKHEQDAREEGTDAQEWYRNQYSSHINKIGSKPKNTEGVEKVKAHLLDHHFRVNEKSEHTTEKPSLPYVVASGYGENNKTYGAHVHEPDDAEHTEAIKRATHFTTEPSGKTGFHIYAHTPEHPEGLHVLKVQTKWNSQPMASNIKNVGTEGTLKPRKAK
jgi:hypothetical protein